MKLAGGLRFYLVYESSIVSRASRESSSWTLSNNCNVRFNFFSFRIGICRDLIVEYFSFGRIIEENGGNNK